MGYIAIGPIYVIIYLHVFVSITTARTRTMYVGGIYFSCNYVLGHVLFQNI